MNDRPGDTIDCVRSGRLGLIGYRLQAAGCSFIQMARQTRGNKRAAVYRSAPTEALACTSIN